jgi:hypothetical protein
MKSLWAVSESVWRTMFAIWAALSSKSCGLPLPDHDYVQAGRCLSISPVLLYKNAGALNLARIQNALLDAEQIREGTALANFVR